MKRIKFTLICTTALMLALSFAGCMHGDSGNAVTPDVDQIIETQSDENTGCPDGKCPENRDGKECPDGKCPDGECPRRDSKENKGGNVDKLPEDGNKCPDGRCPIKRLPHGRGRVVPLPCPDRG